MKAIALYNNLGYNISVNKLVVLFIIYTMQIFCLLMYFH